MLKVTSNVSLRINIQKVRKYTKKAAKKYNVTGWVQNTENKTVKGQCCGSKSDVDKFKNWLETKGSPCSNIERAEFRNEKEVSENPFEAFEIRKVKLKSGTEWA
mmetsp:Transcript_19393/g.23654  ORF Transcript_19393/g.23654 Transcript_19393/m.23654 type:complete len:104 (+) Transcript_19393:168-479(+)